MSMRRRINRGSWIAVLAAVIVGCGGAQATHSPVAAPSAAATAPHSSATTTAPTIAATASAKSTPVASPTINPAAGYTDLKGWLVFEHFGQAPDGSTPNFDIDNRMIWLIHADGSGLHELSPGQPVDGKVSPDISPDGTTIAFSSWAPHSQIWTVPITGGDPTLITTNCSGGNEDCMESDPAWSADGNQLAFVHFDQNGGQPYTEIGIRNLDDGTVHYLDSTRDSIAQGHLAQPAWSPDGTSVVYYRADQTESQEFPTATRAFVAAVDNSANRELPRPPGINWASDPDWSPDGKLIAFAAFPNREGEGWANFPGPDHGIWTIAPDGSDLTNVCNGCLASPQGPIGGVAPSWTEDGRILFWGFKSWALMNADGSDAAHINQAKLTWNGEGLGYNYAAFLQPTP